MSTGRASSLQGLTVLLADGEAAFRRGVRTSLESHGFVVVAEAGDAASAVDQVRRSRPDICLIEIALPGGGPTAIGRIAKASPNTLIVILSQSDRPNDVIGALTRGASGYLLKGITGQQLASTLRAACQGEAALSRSLIPLLVSEIRQGSVRRLALPGGAVTLTPREWEVGKLLLDGDSTAEIADRLGVSAVTVRRHVGLLLQKLGAKNREEAVELLRAHGGG